MTTTMTKKADDQAVPYTCPSCGFSHDAAEDGLLTETYHERLWGLPNSIDCENCGAGLVVVVHLEGKVDAELYR